MMLSFKSVVLVWSLSLSCAADTLRATTPRRLAFEMIANYEPTSLVTGHNAIDLDQAAMEEELANGAFEKAKHFYTDGAYSKSYAELNLTNALHKSAAQDTSVIGLASNGNDVTGKILETVAAGEKAIRVQYHESQIQASYSNCQVGALHHISKANKEGCFVESGSVHIEGVGNYSYTYNVHENNKAARTLQSFSTTAASTMLECQSCPYKTFDKFYKYYGAADYGDQWIMAAFDGTNTSFKNGNNDFSAVASEYRAEAVEKGTVLMNVWMFVIRSMEDAVDKCLKGDKGGDAHAWDEAVAFFTGSLEGSGGTGGGKLVYSLINNRCVDFKTCGTDGNESTGHAFLNHLLRKEFKKGQEHLKTGKCEEARKDKERIESLLAVPLVQGALRSAYILGTSENVDHKSKVAGATFAAAILPIVHHCKPSAAEAIYNALHIGASSTVFSTVKTAFEENYACMGITCDVVGGYYDDANSVYYEGAGPCTHTATTPTMNSGSQSVSNDTSSSSESGANAVGIAFGVTIAVIVVILGAMFYAHKHRKTVEIPPKVNPMFVSPPPPEHPEHEEVDLHHVHIS